MIPRAQTGALRRLLSRSPRPRQGDARSAESQWFWDHYEWAARELVSFCEAGGIELHDLKVADVGCGDGILSLGVFHRAQPGELVGFDIVPTHVETLVARCRAERVADALPDRLTFRASAPTHIPAADGEFGFVYSWSAFEHIADPLAVLREIRRIVRPGGHFFLQLWPFYYSQKGSHLWPWLDEDFHHLTDHEDEVLARVRASNRHPEDWTEYMIREFQQLNRITIGELQAAVLEAGFDVRRLELLTNPIHLQPELARYPWSDLAIGGIKLLALPS